MTSVQDSRVFGNVLSDAPANEIWSDTTRTRYYLAFEASLAKAQAKLGVIPQNAADEIVKWCSKVENVDFQELKAQTERVGYPVLPLVKALVNGVNKVEAGLGEWAHWGTTTQDVTDTATVLQLRDTFNLMSKYLDAIVTHLTDLAERYKSTPMPARSNLQQAVPISFGFKIARVLSTFLRHMKRIQECRPRILTLEFSGAAGTLATIPGRPEHPQLGLDCQALLASELDLTVPEISWHTDRDRIAEFGTICAHLTSSCSKIALDVKLLMQTEVAEASEPYVPHRGSSSTMPNKTNPILCVYITALSATVRQLSTSLFESMANQDHERSTGPWEIEWIVLPQLATLSCACLRHTAELVGGLQVHESAMRRNLDITRGAVVSEAVMMALGEKIGRQYAHDLIYDCCRRAITEDRALIDVLWENDEVQGKIARGDLERLCDPANYLGYSELMTERVVEMARKQR